MLTSPDNELVLRLLADDVTAFDALYNRHSKSLYANIYKLTRDAEVAQDILQEVFIVLWEKRYTIDVTQPVSNWLFAISYYNSIKHLKKALKEQVVVMEIACHNQDSDAFENPADENRLEKLKKAVQELSPQKRKVLEGCKLAGKSYKEVAEELSISRHTVKEYLSLALSSLRTIMK